MSLSFIKALYCEKPNSDARIISETIAASMILPVGRCLGTSLVKGYHIHRIFASNFLHAQHEF